MFKKIKNIGKKDDPDDDRGGKKVSVSEPPRGECNQGEEAELLV